MANVDARLAIFTGSDFNGRRVQFRRGGVAIRDMEAIRFNNDLSSFRLENVSDSSRITLILFASPEFRGKFLVFRGSQNVGNLGNRDFNNDTSSLILVGRRLTDNQIDQIRRTGTPPNDVVVIRR
ncbi:hypothetical protein EHS13_14625 [Paenibacillus psychroresistens]|uniref:Uncharacterized protein n=1 Tax=Paenibacillus psychroresistens TaxID=1778678 RepID=A0A6B8RKE4_9BACL|nr:hypothetical protein [Paenibacillus psychroresistens]QGQ96023.1 hypothetical protein EHS13_14625 [Paenibacillus psychroresistens]